MRRIWSEDEWHDALEMAELGDSCEEIGQALSFTDLQVQGRFINERSLRRYNGPIPLLRRTSPFVPESPPASGSSIVGEAAAAAEERSLVPLPKVPRHLIADRDRRAALRDAQDFSASFFGDPPPGYSAFDRRPSRGRSPSRPIFCVASAFQETPKED